LNGHLELALDVGSVLLHQHLRVSRDALAGTPERTNTVGSHSEHTGSGLIGGGRHASFAEAVLAV
jgi:hypothetical protein